MGILDRFKKAGEAGIDREADDLEALKGRIDQLPHSHATTMTVVGSFAQDPKELVPLISRNISDALTALTTGRDPKGNPITYASVGQGLGNLVDATRGPRFVGGLSMALNARGVAELMNAMDELQGIAERLQARSATLPIRGASDKPEAASVTAPPPVPVPAESEEGTSEERRSAARTRAAELRSEREDLMKAKARQNAIREAEEKALPDEVSPLAAERIKTINVEDPTEVLVEAMRGELAEAKVGDDEFMVHFLREFSTAYEESKAAYHARMAARYGNLGFLSSVESDAERAAAEVERAAAAVVEKFEAIATVIGEELHRRGARSEMDRVLELVGPHQQLLGLEAHWAGISTKDASTFIARLSVPDWKIRCDAAKELGELGDPVAVEPLLRALNDQQGLEGTAAQLVRRAVAEALGDLKDPRAVEPLIRALDDEDDVLRRDAAWALGKLKDARAFEPLLRALQAGDYQTVGGAAAALGELGDARAVEPLVELLKPGGGLVRRIPAVRALAKLNDPRAVEALVAAALRDSDLSRDAERELEQMGGAGAERVLAELRRRQQ